MHILAKEEHHSSLSESYNEIMNHPATTMTTRSQLPSELIALSTTTVFFHEPSVTSKVKVNKLYPTGPILD